jgi:hypothetical protein
MVHGFLFPLAVFSATDPGIFTVVISLLHDISDDSEDPLTCMSNFLPPPGCTVHAQALSIIIVIHP